MAPCARPTPRAPMSGPALVESLHHVLEAAPVLSDAVGLGHEDVVQEQGARGHAARTHLVLLAADGEAAGAALYDEQVDGPRAVAVAGLGSDQDEVGDWGIGAPDLRAVDPVAARAAQGAGADAGDVGAALRLGGRKGAAHLSGRQGTEQATLLIVAAGRQDGTERHPLHDQQVGRVAANVPSSSIATAADSMLSVPPYSFGNGLVNRPTSRSRSNMSCGYSALRSIWSARAATFSRARRRTMS